MNPFLSKELAGEHIRDLREAARGARVRAEEQAPKRERFDRLSVRPFTERDIDAIRLLAALDSKQMPTGAVLVAEQAGEVVAALPLDGGNVLSGLLPPRAAFRFNALIRPYGFLLPYALMFTRGFEYLVIPPSRLLLSWLQ